VLEGDREAQARPAATSLIGRLVAASLASPLWAGVLVCAVIAGGLWAFANLDIEAYPDPVPPRIEVITQPPGWSSEEVERLVTLPLETALSGMLGLDVCRSISIFELSDIKCYFGWDTNYRWDKEEVLDRLQLVSLPNNLQPQLSPGNPIGEIFRYTLSAPPGYGLEQIKAAEDWTLEKSFKQVTGVIDVTSFGGLTKQYQVEVDPYRMKGQGITLPQITAAIANANLNVGGNVLTLGEQAFNLRGLGLIQSTKDIDRIVLQTQKGVPTRVSDIATTEIGFQTRRGIVGHDAEPDVVEGIVLMRRGGDTLKTLAGVREKIDEIRKEHLLPPGMDIRPYYDRTELVQVTTHTIYHNLSLGMLLVVIVLLVFLGNVRAALITALNIPLALLVAFFFLVVTGTSANLISLGAVDFGIIVESTVIMMENCFHHLSQPGDEPAIARITAAASEVGGPMAFSTLIIGVAFLPLFTLTGVEGVIFSPMAHTYAFAIGGAIVLAIVVTPNLSRLLPVGKGEKEGWVGAAIKRIYHPIFAFSLRRPKTALAIGAVPILACVALYGSLGSEFMPKLEEGNLWVRATLPISISLEQSSKYVSRMREIFKTHPEVVTVISQLGRPDDGTDVAGFYNMEFFVPLKPFDEWKNGMTKPRLTELLSGELSEAFPGVVFNFSQNIEDNVEEALSGVKGENTVKIVGADLKADEELGQKIIATLSKVRGIADLAMFQSLGQPNINVVPDRELCARNGLNVGDVLGQVQVAVGGQAVTQVYEGEKRFDLTVRWAKPYRVDIARVKEIPIATPSGAQIPLANVAHIELEDGPALIYREQNKRYVPVKFSVRGRDLAGTIEEAQSRVKAEISLPYDVHLEWAGEINQLREANQRLALIVPLTLVLIGLLVYAAVGAIPEALVVLSNIPVASAGGFLALLFSGINFSISAAMGFISIFGIAIQDGLLVVSYAQRLRAAGHPWPEAVELASKRALRPVLMTALVAMLGLIPAALSHAIGSQTQKPLAVVVIGGALMLAVMPRLVLPALLLVAHKSVATKSGPPVVKRTLGTEDGQLD